MMQLASTTVTPPSTSTGKRFIGHSAVNSCMAGLSGPARRRSSNGVPFSYNAISTFWQ